MSGRGGRLRSVPECQRALAALKPSDRGAVGRKMPPANKRPRAAEGAQCAQKQKRQRLSPFSVHCEETLRGIITTL